MMKTLLAILIALTPALVLAQEPFECKEAQDIAALEEHHHQSLIHFRANELTQDYDLKYHRLEWSVDPAQNYISGTVTSYFVPISDDFQAINFDFAQNMTINAVIYRGDTLTSEFRDGDNLRIDLPETLIPGVLDSITVIYEGAPNSTGFGSFEIGQHAGVPVLWTLSEPYGAKVWWPCKQDLNDKIDSVDILITTPSEYRAGSQGLLVDEIEHDSTTTYHWRHRYPIPAYLISMAVTNYAVFSDYAPLSSGDSIEILNYVYPEDLETAKVWYKATIDQMVLFDSLFGPYPFAREKYGHAHFGWGGGMEHQTMSSMGAFFPSLQAHELAHQWFGNKVTCGSWKDIWLNEGFASYITGLSYLYLGFENEWNNWKAGRLSTIVSQPGGSVYVDDTTSVGRIFDTRLTYRKGGYLLHMLRWIMGDDDFYLALRNYLADPELAFGYAKSADLQRHLEETAGIELDEFFDDWLYGQGHPSYEVKWAAFEVETDSIQFEISQSTSHPSVDFFEMPLPIRLISEDGQRDTMIRLNHEYNNQGFVIATPFRVGQVEFDPELWLISADNSVIEIVDDVIDPGYAHNSITIVPNPARERFKIVFETPVQGIASVDVFDMTGRLMFQTRQIDSVIRIGTSDWPGGLYSVTLRTTNGSLIAKKVMITR